MDDKFLEQAARERANQRRLRKQINNAIRSAIGTSPKPTNAGIDSAIHNLEESRPNITGMAADHAVSSLQQGNLDARKQLGRHADRARPVDQNAVINAASAARTMANREIDLRIRQLEAAKYQTPKATLRNIAAIRAAAGNRVARDTTYTNQNEAFFDSIAHLPVKVVWVTSLDERVRHTHAAQHGEMRNVGEAFSNGCRFPHDPLAPIEETAGCRCRLKIVTRGALAYQDAGFLET